MSRMLSALPSRLAEQAQRFHAASAAAHEALRREHDTLRRMQFALACMRAEMAGKDAPDDASWDAAAAAAAGEVVAGRAGGVAARMVTGGVGALTDNVSRGVRRLVRMHASETLRKPTRM